MNSDQANLRLPHLHKHGPRQEADKYPTPASADPSEYTDEESAFLCAVSRFRAINKVSSPTLCQLLWILKQLGYTCGEQQKAHDVDQRQR